MLNTSNELKQAANLEINEEILLNIPDSIKIKLLNRILKDTDSNVCLQFLTTEFIGATLLSVYNKSSALCVFNRTLKTSVRDVPSEECREAFYNRITRVIDAIGISRCPHTGKCPTSCTSAFKLNEDFLNKISPEIKMSLYDKIVRHFVERKNTCFLTYTLVFLLEYFNDHLLYSKAKQLEGIIVKTIPIVPFAKCRSSMRKEVNKINNNKNG